MADPATRLKIAVNVQGIPELQKLRTALGGVENSTMNLGAQFSRSRRELKLLEQSIKPSINSTRSLRDAYREMANQVEFGSRKFKVATREAERLEKQLAKMEGRSKGAGAMRGVAQTVGTVAGAGVFGGFEGAAGALIGAGFGGPAGAVVGGAIGAQVGQIRQALGATAEYAAEITKLRIALEGVTQGTDEYAEALKIINTATKDFAIPQSTLTRQFTRLQAAVEGAGGNVADTEVAFRGIVAAVRATGGSLQDVDSALTATAQVFSKGKVSAEELRQQIGERLPGAFSLFAEAVGMTPQELDAALEKGQVSLLDFQKFAELLFERYGETAQEIANGPESAGDRLKVALEKLNESVGKLLQPIGAAFQETFAQIVDAITGAIDALNRFNQANNVKAANAYRAEAARLPKGSPAQLFAIKQAEAMERAAGLTGGLIGPEMPARLRRSNLPGITPEVSGKGGRKGGRTREDISAELRDAQIAAIWETNEGKKLEIEFEAKLLQLRESGLEQRRREVKLQEALKTLSDGRAKIEERQTKEAQKRTKEFESMIKSFQLGNAKQFDMNAQAKQKTPFDSFIEGAKEYTKSLGGVLEATKKLGEVGFKGLGDAITELVVNGTLNFREFAANLLREMARIIMQQLVVKALMELIGFGVSSVSTSNYNLANTPDFSSKLTNVNTGSSGFTMYAKGGITSGPSIAGEAGPEAVVPLPDGRSIPVTMKGGGVGNIIVNVDASGTKAQGDDPTARRLGDLIGNAVKEELIQQKRPGGLLY